MKSATLSDMKRCSWANPQSKAYLDYHDTEWGVPVTDDTELFEFLILEGAQAGLSWETILNKREGYRKIFKRFNPQKVAAMTESEIAAALLDASIVRNRLKVRSAVTNAQAFIAIQKEFGSFAKYLWDWVENAPVKNSFTKMSQVPAETDLAKHLSKDLKKRGFTFVGPTIMYAYLQAVGVVNDHVTDCFRYDQISDDSISV